MAKKLSKKQLEGLTPYPKPSDTQSTEAGTRVLFTLYPDDRERLDRLAAELTDGNKSMLVRLLLRERAEGRGE
jgi:hypothetical protein